MGKPHTSLKGQLLLDGGKLRGSCFHRTVVLICEHNKDGAFGLILNRPSENKLADVFETKLPDLLKGKTLFGGGPVQPAALSYLHSDLFLPDANVMENLQLGHELDELVEIGEAWSASKQLRVFAGYAGWSPGQLDDEMRRQAWLTHPASLELVFHTPADQLWQHVLRRRADWQSRLLAETPEDLSWN
jgi:putative transcriptional regulator